MTEKIDIASFEEGALGPPNDSETTLKFWVLPPVVWFFITINLFVDGMIFVLAFQERKHPSFGAHVVTDRVLMAMLAGNTVQVGAVIIAAFRGLFGSKAKS